MARVARTQALPAAYSTPTDGSGRGEGAGVVESIAERGFGWGSRANLCPLPAVPWQARSTQHRVHRGGVRVVVRVGRMASARRTSRLVLAGSHVGDRYHAVQRTES